MSTVDPYGGRKNRLMPSLVINDAAGAIDFYKRVFGAEEKHRSVYNGQIAHAEIDIEGTTIMMSDEMYGDRAKSAKTIGDTPVSFYVYVKDVEAIFDKVKKDVRVKLIYGDNVETMFYGDRIAMFEDPYGFRWTIATHVKDVGDEEMKKGLDDMMKEHTNTKHTGGYGRNDVNDKYYKKYMKYKSKYLARITK